MAVIVNENDFMNIVAKQIDQSGDQRFNIHFFIMTWYHHGDGSVQLRMFS
ncbi:MAG: hypothetical protein NVSMB30_31250 [Hymenobacter sp.]